MQNKVVKVFAIVFAAALLLAIGMCVYSIATFGFDAEPIFFAVVAAFGVYYILAGCKKGEGSVYFKWFVNLFALCALLALKDHAALTLVGVLLIAIRFGCLTVLSVALNLGRKKSLTLSGIVFADALVGLVLALCLGGATLGILINVSVQALLGATTVFMVCAKYADKAARGSK